MPSRQQSLTIGIVAPIELDWAGAQLGVALTRGLGSPLIADLTDWLIKRGHHVVVFTLSPIRSDEGFYRSRSLSLFVGPYRPKARWVDAFRVERRALAEAISSTDCDLLHAHWTYEFALAALDSNTAPVLVTVHDWGPAILRNHFHPYRMVRLGMQIKVLFRARHLSAVSPYIAAKVRRYYRRDAIAIPNAVNLPQTPPLERVLRWPPTIGALNNGFSRLKNVGALLHGFAQLRRDLPGAVLRLAGIDYETFGPAYRYARQHELLDNVEFLGPIGADEVPTFLRSIDILAHPSLEESFSRTLIEAMAEGTLVIGGIDSGAVPWVLREGEAGVLVDVRDPRAIAEGVLSLADASRSDTLRLRGWDQVTQNFSWPRVVEQYEALYYSLVL